MKGAKALHILTIIFCWLGTIIGAVTYLMSEATDSKDVYLYCLIGFAALTLFLTVTSILGLREVAREKKKQAAKELEKTIDKYDGESAEKEDK